MNQYPSFHDELRAEIAAIEAEVHKPEFQTEAMRNISLKDAFTLNGKVADSMDNIQRICDTMREILDQLEY